MDEDALSVTVPLRMSPRDIKRLDVIASEGGQNGSTLIRSLVRGVLDDDEAAHKPGKQVVVIR